MKNKLLYDEVIKGYGIMENTYTTLFKLITLLENNEKEFNNYKLKKLVNELEAEKKSIILQKEKFIRIFSPILNDEKEFEKQFSSFKLKDSLLKEQFIKIMKKRIKMLKMRMLKLIFFRFISNFFQMILKIFVVFIIANTFFNFIEIPNNLILLTASIIIGFFTGYIFSVLIYRKTLNKTFELFKTKKYKLLFSN